jgi:predicted O-methyltransferase YrrM
MVIWHNLSNIHIHQNLFEFCGWLNILDEIQPKTGLEIGTYFFGTSQMCLEAIPTIQTLITVDIEDRWKDKEKDLLKYGNRLKFIMGNSQNQEIIDTIVKLSPFDFLFIDGDQSYDCVVNDF